MDVSVARWNQQGERARMSASSNAESGSEVVRLRIQVHGQVQGVFFRARAQERAQALGISGFARNEPDGTVTVECEGPAHAVEEMRAWCETGPPRAEVERIETTGLEPNGETGFRRL